MRIILIVMVLCFGALNAQQAALTAGSESLSAQSDKPSITSQETVTVNNGNYTQSADALEPQLKPAPATLPAQKSETNILVYLVSFLLLGIAFYFINLKIKNNLDEINTIHLESEEQDERKKKIWEKLSVDQNKDSEHSF